MAKSPASPQPAKPAAKKAAPKKPAAPKEAAAEAVMASPESLKDQAKALAQDAGAKAKDYATTGKDKTADAMGELGRMADDLAATLDEKFGPQYGDYVRKAGNAVSGGADSLKGKTVDDLVDDARTFVREKPAIAIGAAALVGFALTRLFRAGGDDDD